MVDDDRLDNLSERLAQFKAENFVSSAQIRSINESIAAITAPFTELNSERLYAALRPMLEATRALGNTHWTLSRADNFRNPDPQVGPYSGHLRDGVEDYFTGREITIDSVQALNQAIQELVQKVPSMRLVWRGARSVTWGVHSSLFRHLMTQNGVDRPEIEPTAEQKYPDEHQMVAAEQRILELARMDWRFDGMSALEIFARVQHFGGPTRLLDITLNPYVAAWFAVEDLEETRDHDSRLLAFAVEYPEHDETEKSIPSQVVLDSVWGGHTPVWHEWTDTVERQLYDWGTGSRRWYWIPPAYHARITVQNAGFLLDGVPITSPAMASSFRPHSSAMKEGASSSYYRRADLLAASSMYMKADTPTRKPQVRSNNLAPTFGFRIEASAKEDIRRFLESRFGFTRSYIYPDMEAFAQHLNKVEFDE